MNILTLQLFKKISIAVCIVFAIGVLATPSKAKQGDAILDLYLTSQQKLAADDLASTKALAHEIQKLNSLGKLDSKIWAKCSTSVLALSKAPDIKSARKSFYTWSNQMIDLVKVQPKLFSVKYQMAYCPMAITDKGAFWLQSAKAIENPYFGNSMLRCGEFRAIEGHDQ